MRTISSLTTLALASPINPHNPAISENPASQYRISASLMSSPGLVAAGFLQL